MSLRNLDPTVADELAFDQWPEEMKRIARAGLHLEVEAMRDDLKEEAEDDATIIDEANAGDAARWRWLCERAVLATGEDGEVVLYAVFGEQDDYREKWPALMKLLDNGTAPASQAVLFLDTERGV